MQALNCHNRTWMPNQRIGLLIDAAVTILVRRRSPAIHQLQHLPAEWNEVWASDALGPVTELSA